MDIEYEIAREGYELFGNEHPCEVFVPWKPDPNEEYPLILDLLDEYQQIKELGDELKF